MPENFPQIYFLLERMRRCFNYYYFIWFGKHRDHYDTA